MSTGRKHWNLYKTRKWGPIRGAISLYFSTITPTLGAYLAFDKWSVRLSINLLLVGGFIALGRWK